LSLNRVKLIVILSIVCLTVFVFWLGNKRNKPRKSYLQLQEERRIQFVEAGEKFTPKLEGLLLKRDVMLDFICILTRRKLGIKELPYDEAMIRHIDQVMEAHDRERKRKK